MSGSTWARSRIRSCWRLCNKAHGLPVRFVLQMRSPFPGTNAACPYDVATLFFDERVRSHSRLATISDPEFGSGTAATASCSGPTFP